MKTNTNKYAIVSKTQCCTNWKHSFEVLPYEIDGKIQEPNSDIVKNDNLSGIQKVEDFKDFCESIERQVEIPDSAKFVIDDYQSGEVSFFDNYQDALKSYWGEVYSGDWQYSIYTVQEAFDELKKDILWINEYQKETISKIENIALDELDFADITFNFEGFLEYIKTSTHAYSKSHCLVEIAEKYIEG